MKKRNGGGKKAAVLPRILKAVIKFLIGWAVKVVAKWVLEITGLDAYFCLLAVAVKLMINNKEDFQ